MPAAAQIASNEVISAWSSVPGKNTQDKGTIGRKKAHDKGRQELKTKDKGRNKDKGVNKTCLLQYMYLSKLH